MDNSIILEFLSKNVRYTHPKGMVYQPISDINMKPTEGVFLLLPLCNLITDMLHT